jgi:hypothetical protein
MQLEEITMPDTQLTKEYTVSQELLASQHGQRVTSCAGDAGSGGIF